MAPFLVVSILVGLLGAWSFRRHANGPGARDPATGWIVGALLALPFLYAAIVVATAGDRLEGLQLRYVGKRIAWGPGIPLTAGGSEDGSEDLHHPLLAPDALRLEAADAESAEALGVAPGTGLLRLSAGAPVARIDGRPANAVPLEEGDRLELDRPGGGEPLVLLLADGALTAAGGAEAARHPLPGPLARLLRPGRIVYLPDVLTDAAPEWSAGARGGYRSMLEHAGGGWRLLLRDADLQVVRDGEALPGLETPRAVPGAFDLSLEVAWGAPGARRLRTVRTDRLRLGDDAVEVRFDEPQRRRVPPAVASETGEVGLVVPTAVDRRAELIELDERSHRFHGLAATLAFDPSGESVDLAYLGGRWPLVPDELYGLGEGADLMLLRFDLGRSPARVLVDLALFGLFCAVFLGRVSAKSPALTALLAAAGVLLADRLLFAFRAATEPPHYLARSYGEARVAIWLVPALLLFGWTLAVLLRRTGRGRADGSARGASGWSRGLAQARQSLRPLAWPLTGLAAAAGGCFATVRGPGVGSLRALSLIPIVLAALLVAAHAWASGTGSERLQRWRERGWRFPLWVLPAAGAAILLARLIGLALGMPEALRLPGTELRLLWSAVELPLGALLVGLGCQRLAERGWPRGAPSDVLRALGAFWGFIALAYVAVGLLAADRGLILVHALAPLFALVLVVGHPSRVRTRAGRAGGGVALGVALALLPLVLLVAVNRFPLPFVGVYDRLATLGADDEGAEAASGLAQADPAARYRASPEQQRFRLLMLANPELLTAVGLRPSEQAAVQYQTMKSYAREAGFAGHGFASSELPRHLGVTYLNDLMPMAFVLADFGKLGMLGLALVYLVALGGGVAAVVAVRRPAGREGEGRRWPEQGAWIAAAALLAFALPGLYMILANLNLVLFTGKNASLLALNSTSDVLQSGALLALAGFGLALAEEPS